MKLARSRHSLNMDEEIRSEIYDVFEKYESIKSSRGEYDVSDATFSIYWALKTNKVRDRVPSDHIYVDEVFYIFCLLRTFTF